MATIRSAAVRENVHYTTSLDNESCKQYQRSASNSEDKLCHNCHSSIAFHKLTARKKGFPLLTVFTATRNVRVTLSTGQTPSSALQRELIDSLLALQDLPVSTSTASRNANNLCPMELLEEATALRVLLPLPPLPPLDQHEAALR